MIDEIQIVALIGTVVFTVAPLYYRIGKLEQKICQLYKLVNLKARWKK